jgi:hypothetical protein
MNKIYLKLWIITPLLLISFLVYSHYKDKKAIEENAAVEVLGIEEQNIDESDLIIEKSPQETTSNEIYKVGIPYYWKSGINIEEKDPLKGYIPNIKDFRKYFEANWTMLFGTSERNTEEIFTEEVVLDEGKYIYSNSIENASSYFMWDSESCTEMFFTEVGSDVFICKNWVNWLGNPLSEKTFVLTRCNINNKSGYCVFEDYLREYYNMKTISETRCFGTDSTEYICEYSDYTDLVEFN